MAILKLSFFWWWENTFKNYCQIEVIVGSIHLIKMILRSFEVTTSEEK